MARAWKGILAGIAIGVAGTLLLGSLGSDQKGAPEQLAEAVGCADASDGVHPRTAAFAHRHGYSWFAVTHAERILSISCDPLGPGTTYLEFERDIEMSHVLATLDNRGAVCLAGQAVFEGTVLDGREQLKELCGELGGQVKLLAG